MAVSAAKKKANQKWDTANMATLACKVKKDQAERFREYCTNKGETVNAALQGYISSCIGDNQQQKSAGMPQGSGDILTPEALKTAQDAAEKAGETAPEFVGRAVETQAKRDKVALAIRPKEKAPDHSGT